MLIAKPRPSDLRLMDHLELLQEQIVQVMQHSKPYLRMLDTSIMFMQVNMMLRTYNVGDGAGSSSSSDLKDGNGRCNAPGEKIYLVNWRKR